MTPTLTPATPTSLDLLRQYHHSPSIGLRNQIVQLNQGLVQKIAHRVSHQCSEPFEDLAQLGYLGLIRAIERFEPHHGYAFSSFAVPYIRGEMLHFLRDRSATLKIPRRIKDLQKSAHRTQETLRINLQRRPTAQEIAAHLNISLQDWQELQLADRNRFPLSLDSTFSPYSDVPVPLGDTLVDEHYQSCQRSEEDRQQLQAALAQLEIRDRTVLEWVFIQGLSRKEVAQRIGVSPITVSRWIQQSMQQLMTILQSPLQLSA
ncbi:sigma-70 family RNA polymerase sigma factor [Prochlorothrix hollandica]|uniref:RNA polymerase sigma factor SigF n=1 Tax=Prochlorothrix hollandica PCC 9006 = CALU 1027 TaxID=317619 RepID=A0A0M2PSR0_PROHO|nr:sigma-70 family RNA polymerase sigma factor [Prochlorothrix hollandica]KKI99159.1 RNA polymerase sigma factor SigF [Prochlorothrix hollandica PCC 9006 = CALU 1027]